MIVYGDPCLRVRAQSLFEEIIHLTKHRTLDDLDACRTLMIKAGQLEQGVADLPPTVEPDLLSALERITDAAARQFTHAYQQRNIAEPTIAHLCSNAALAFDPELFLKIKVPEGFAFYTLYPEQYIMTAQKWLAGHPNPKTQNVLVIGLRSIGTALSAVVAATLRASGCHAYRFTVRPQGHPFQRRVELPECSIRGFSFAIIVDEGPGLSGSSMAAVAEALSRHGFCASRITFFPGHGNEPGHAAPEFSRRWWSRVERVVTPLHDVRWNGEPLLPSLQARTETVLGAKVVQIHDASGGLWRCHAYSSEADWPAAIIPFERAKYIFELSDGRRVIWKFTGLQRASLPGMSGSSFQSPPRADLFRGFTAESWLEGIRLKRDLGGQLAEALGNHIEAVSTPPLDVNEVIPALDRIGNMAYWNTRETLGENAAEVTRRMLNQCREFIAANAMAGYGDGRMAPPEFVRNEDGVVYKTDCGGHDIDHTVVGKQSVLWDVAGTIVEWELRGADVERLIRAAGTEAPPTVLDFYCAAYAAFRLGMLSMSSNAGEGERAAREMGRVECWLRTLLLTAPATSSL